MLCSGGSFCVFYTTYRPFATEDALFQRNFALAFLPPAFYNETTKWGKVG